MTLGEWHHDAGAWPDFAQNFFGNLQKKALVTAYMLGSNFLRGTKYVGYFG